MMHARARPKRRGMILVSFAAILLSVALFVIGSGRWRDVYIFFVQFHQQSLWAALVVLSIPVLLVIFLRAWGVENVPYEEEVTELGSGRLSQVARRIAKSHRNVYRQALLVDELSEIASQVVAINEGLEASTVRKQCRSGEWAGHPVIARLIRNRELRGPDAESFVTRFERVLAVVESTLKGGSV
ncbi:hypothetical protein ACFLTM_00580 [Candidatus Bipolaricaulota bacterium]